MAQRLQSVAPILLFSQKEVQTMRKRRAVRAYKDRRVFSHTADKTKAVNVRPMIMRGGFRL